MKITNELKERLNPLVKGFRMYLIEKPRSEEEVLLKIHEYQSERDEEYRFYKKESNLRMERDGIEYKIEVIEAIRTLLIPSPKFGTLGGTWAIEVSEVKE